jgi:hypothetical protein
LKPLGFPFAATWLWLCCCFPAALPLLCRSFAAPLMPEYSHFNTASQLRQFFIAATFISNPVPMPITFLPVTFSFHIIGDIL